MEQVEMIMPKMGESIMEGTILSWLKKEGDHIEQDESVLEVATDKVDTEVPATHAGVLKQILAKEGEVVAVGKPIAIIAIEAAKGGQNGENETGPQKETESQIEKNVTTEPIPVKDTTKDPKADSLQRKTASGRFYSPLVLNISRKEGITMEELEQVA